MLAQRTRLLEAEVVETGARVVVCDTDLDAAKGQALAEYLLALAGRAPGGHLEVDLGHVRGLCSSCLGKLVGLDRRLRANGGRLSLLGVRGEVSEVFRLTHLTGVLDIHEAV
jgi:anti-anti-sigma factor